MNSIWNKNLALFRERFPALAEAHRLGEADGSDIPRGLRADIEVLAAKSGAPTAIENGRFLHSRYDPLREADGAAREAKKQGGRISAACFFGIGLGYAAASYARRNPDDTLIIVEPDAPHFFTAMSVADLSDLLAHPRLFLAVQTGTDVVVELVEKAGGFSRTAIVENTNQSAHAKDYFDALRAAIARAKRKDTINTATLERFSRLWMKNSCRNRKKLAELDGVCRYENRAGDLPFVILAAGPTLQDALPHLSALKERAVVVAVDTALRACLRAGTEPDFIVLSDPQFYAFQHIQGLSSKSSVLITELAAYPSVFRFPCKETILMSPFFPVGRYFEEPLGKKGELSSGGSVSTTAWDFARLAGARRIYCAGLDLGFPALQTHIKGATFEEKAHTASGRLSPAETAGCAALFSANRETAEDYDGGPILTDNRMRMFSWWFESKSLEHPEIESYSLSPRSLRIPGFRTRTIEELLREPERAGERERFLSSRKDGFLSDGARSERERLLAEREVALLGGLSRLGELARRGIAVCEEGIRDGRKRSACLLRLGRTDEQILRSEFKDIASLVFPTERQLDALFSATAFSQDKAVATLQHSEIIYRALLDGIGGCQKCLRQK